MGIERTIPAEGFDAECCLPRPVPPLDPSVARSEPKALLPDSVEVVAAHTCGVPHWANSPILAFLALNETNGISVRLRIPTPPPPTVTEGSYAGWPLWAFHSVSGPIVIALPAELR